MLFYGVFGYITTADLIDSLKKWPIGPISGATAKIASEIIGYFGQTAPESNISTE